MTPDPYPDLAGAEPPDALLDDAPGSSGAGARVAREELSEADSRLLAALSRPATHVVTAAEDEPPATSRQAPLPAAVRSGPVTPVFQEPTG